MPSVKQLEPKFRKPLKHKLRKHLNMDVMIFTVRNGFEAIPVHRLALKEKFSLPDALMSG